MKNISILFSFFIFLVSSAFCSQGEELYKRGDFKSAADFYYAQTLENPYDYSAFYNYANCLYRLKDKAGALAYYMKAFEINPRNSDLFYNLNFLSVQTQAGLFPQDIPSFVYRTYFFLSLNEIKAAAFLSFWSFCLFSSFFFLEKAKNLSKTASVSFAALAVIFSLLYFFRINSVFHSAAVIKNSQARIMSGPGEDFKLIASADNAKPVKIISETGEWIEIGLIGQGIKGWIKSEDIIKI